MPRLGTFLALAAALALAACGSRPTGPTPPPITDPGGTGTGTGTPPPPPPPPPTLNVTRILAFGDSMTSGTTSPVVSLFGLDAGIPQSYPFKLQLLETERYSTQTITVLNAGSGGNKAKDDRARLADAVREGSPQVVLLLEGANDLNSGESIRQTVDALEDMVRDTQALGITVLLATLPPQRPGEKNTGNAALIPSLNDAIRVMAGKKGATLVDLNAQFPIELIGQDGLHPTEDGYEKVAEIFQAAIASKWEQAPAAARN
jgi:lysophospholipase L1-like esterase